MSSILSSKIFSLNAFSTAAILAQQEKPNIPWWFWAIMAAALILLVWMLFNRPKEEGEEEESLVEEVKIPEPEPAPVQETAFDLSEEASDYEPFSGNVLLEDEGQDETEEQPTPSPFFDINEEDLENIPVFDDYQVQPDDFSVIEGISPKIAKLLAQSDIQSYRQLAETSVEKLQVILASAGIFLTDPASWPDQARLAGDDRWDELRQFQDSLKGGTKD